MAMPSPQDAANRWAQNLGASTAKIQAGVQAVTVSPGQSAARQKAVWVQNVANSQDKWARNVAAVSTAQWQNDMINKGLPRIGSGAQASVDKVTTVFTKLFPYISQGVSALPPRGTLDQNINRAVSMIRHMSQFQK